MQILVKVYKNKEILKNDNHCLTFPYTKGSNTLNTKPHQQDALPLEKKWLDTNLLLAVVNHHCSSLLIVTTSSTAMEFSIIHFI